jgi:hypothetical protein
LEKKINNIKVTTSTIMNARLTTVASIENWKCGMWNDDSEIIIPNTEYRSLERKREIQ